MPFIAKDTIIDISIDFNGSDVILRDSEDQILRPAKKPNGTNVQKWASLLTDPLKGRDIEGKTEEEVAAIMALQNDPAKAFEVIAKNVDYWYGKGIPFWLNEVPYAMLKNIHGFLNEQLFMLKKK